MAAKSSIRSYNAFVRNVRKEHGLSLKEARAAYRTATNRLGRPARGVDVSKHPRITKEAARQAPGAVKREERREAKAAAREKRSEAARKGWESRRKSKERDRGAVGDGGGGGGGGATGKAYSSLADYIDWYNDYEWEYDYDEADGTVDY